MSFQSVVIFLLMEGLTSMLWLLTDQGGCGNFLK
jgi:hypothetical protein